MKTRILLAAALTIGAASCPRSAEAQASGFAVNRFEPSVRGSEWFVNESLDLRGSMRPAVGIAVDWAYEPLVLYEAGNPSGKKRADVITDQVFLHAGGALVFFDRFRVGASLPVVIYQHGDELTGIAVASRAPNKASVGDARVSAEARLFGTYGDALNGAASLQVHLPTGKRAQFTGDGTVRITPGLLLAGYAEGFVYAARLGLQFRPLDEAFEGRALGSEVLFSIAAGVKVNDRFVFGPELYGSTVVAGGGNAFRTRTTPLEVLLGGHITLAEHWKLGTAIGPGITHGDGTPKMRVIASLEYAPDICVDKDGDGVCAERDACPEVEGVKTGDPKTNGCPADRDHDGFLDAEDVCPDQRGTRTLDPKTLGCPDRDNDAIADTDVACPEVAGVATDDPKTNGCPRPGAE